MVSVVIPTYHREDAIVRALEGVTKQTYTDIEILVIDDNGEGTEHQIATKHAVEQVKDSRIRYISHAQNLGGCAARNTGIKNSKGEYIGFLDDDDIWSDKFIEEMLPCFTNDRIGAVFCDYYSYNGVYSYTFKNFQDIEGDVYSRILGGWCPASTSLFIVKRTDIISAGLFNDGLMSFQDYDMWLRLSRICEFSHCRKRLVLKYEGFGEQTSRNPDRRKSGYQQVVQKYTSLLSENDLKVFQGFIKKFYFDTLYRTIVYNHKHKLDYTREKREYLGNNSTIKDKLLLYMKLYLPERLYAEMERIRSKDTLIFHKGKFPV